ncbi:hypothetical protein SLEP1_g37269 [Rubroshorea leprosula]|uniref:Uncharacterized protein n=1 Tax=Rubroshorea leprosula TaxID=152421 RepID=A0AAV5KU85_9ROSI|nr:hypothetical protein SLEP1_g37269 [Rubroshorea leprosula]
MCVSHGSPGQAPNLSMAAVIHLCFIWHYNLSSIVMVFLLQSAVSFRLLALNIGCRFQGIGFLRECKSQSWRFWIPYI